MMKPKRMTGRNARVSAELDGAFVGEIGGPSMLMSHTVMWPRLDLSPW